MKIYFSLILLLTISGLPVLAQQKNPKTQAELGARMKAAQKDMDKLSPEQKKMMEQMGIPTSANPQLPAVSNKAFADAVGGPVVPEKNPNKIAAISKSALNGASLPSFLSSTHNFVLTKLRPATKTASEKIYNQLKADGKSPFVIGNSAAGLWLIGRIEPALYIMGKACEQDASNTDNLSNYASMLTMCGAEQLAIPILNMLNAQFPKNTTLLNNLGQAWFGVGETTKAEKYFDSVILIYAYHPQANFTKSFIEESKGHKTEAITYVKKSIKYYYSIEKHNRLRKLGYKLTASDISFHRPFKPNSDPLGLHNFKTPPFPKSADELVAFSEDWKIFNAELSQKAEQLQQQRNSSNTSKITEFNKNAENYLNNKPSEAVDPKKPLYYPIGKLMLEAMDKEGGTSFQNKSAQEALKKYIQTDLKTLKTEYGAGVKIIDALDEKHAKECKIPGGCEIDGFCIQRKELLTKYLQKISPRFEELYLAYLKAASLKLNEEIYWKQFCEAPAQFAITQLSYKQQWLSILTPAFAFDLSDKDPFNGFKCIEITEAKNNAGKFPDFNTQLCKFHTELNFIIFKRKLDCSTMTTEINLKVVEFNMKQDDDKDDFIESFIGCTIKLEADVPLAGVKAGPLEIGTFIVGNAKIEIDREGIKNTDIKVGVKAGTKVEINGVEIDAAVVSGIEFENDRSGTTDVSIYGEAGVEASALGTKLEAGAEWKTSIVTGNVTIKGKGILE